MSGGGEASLFHVKRDGKVGKKKDAHTKSMCLIMSLVNVLPFSVPREAEKMDSPVPAKQRWSLHTRAARCPQVDLTVNKTELSTEDIRILE